MKKELVTLNESVLRALDFFQKQTLRSLILKNILPFCGWKR